MRKHYLDNLKTYAIINVVIYHSIFIYCGLQPTYGSLGPFKDGQIIDGILYLLYPALPILFLVSGITARISLERHTEKEFIKSHTIKLLIPSTLGLFVYHFMCGYYNVQLTDALTVFAQYFPTLSKYVPDCVVYVFAGISVLWFLHELYILTLLLIPLRRWLKGKFDGIGKKCNIIYLVLLGVPFYFCSQILNVPCAVCYRFGIYGFAFFSGYFLFYHENVMKILEKNFYLLKIIELILGAYYIYYGFGKSPMVSPLYTSIPALAYSWFKTLTLLAFAKRFLDKQTKLFKFLNSEAWGMYILHYFPIVVLATYLRKTSLGTNPYICYPLTLLAGFGGSFCLNHVISKIPILRYCVLGIKRKKV